MSEMDSLKNLGRAYLDIARDQMARSGMVTPVLILCSASGLVVLISVDQRVMENEMEKEIFSRAIKRRVKEDKIMAVGSMFDSLVFDVPDERREEVLRLRSTGMTSREIADSGIGKYSQAVVFSIDLATGEGVQLILEYESTPDGLKFAPVREQVVSSSEGRMYFFGG